jgi:hypothetical protein
MILDSRLIDRQKLRCQPRLQCVRAERAQGHCRGPGQRAQDEEQLQRTCLAFFFSRRCGRFLP